MVLKLPALSSLTEPSLVSDRPNHEIDRMQTSLRTHLPALPRPGRPESRGRRPTRNLSYSPAASSSSGGPGVDTGDESDFDEHTWEPLEPAPPAQADGHGPLVSSQHLDMRAAPLPSTRPLQGSVRRKDALPSPDGPAGSSQTAQSSSVGLQDSNKELPPLLHSAPELRPPVPTKLDISGDPAHLEPLSQLSINDTTEAGLGTFGSTLISENPTASGSATAENQDGSIRATDSSKAAQTTVNAGVPEIKQPRPPASSDARQGIPSLDLEDRWWEENEENSKALPSPNNNRDARADQDLISPRSAAESHGRVASSDVPSGAVQSQMSAVGGASPSLPSARHIVRKPVVDGTAALQRNLPPLAVPPPNHETYQIKHINWTDGTFGDCRRASILVQNVNGPCPLVALVNALSLSSSLAHYSGLAETLRLREQISLGLLLDAVLDELISSRADAATPDLPDVSEVYRFLMTLHTGMNVNPRFVQPPQPTLNLMDASVDESNDAIRDSQEQPPGLGIFEETREVQLYGTFRVPFVHGWLPNKDHPAYAALQRSAPTYEDAQNLLFREEELEEKLRAEGLSRDEQQLLQDVVIIKYFFSQSATQLTKHGLEVLSKALASGSPSILFRNDHFSTIFVHPSSGQLLQLVTDMGYAGHPEIVWESLVDVTGEGSEFFAGDFRAVSHQPLNDDSSSSRPVGSVGDNNTLGWTVVGDRSSREPKTTSQGRDGLSVAGMGSIDERLDISEASTNASVSANDQGTTPRSPTTEQEDHDLALALQLQEEEEDRHRRDLAGTRRGSNTRPSRQSLPSSSSYPLTSARRVGLRGGAGLTSSGQRVRSLISPIENASSPARPRSILIATPAVSRSNGGVNRSADEPLGAEAPPPTYEQAARASPYYPPPSHPAHSGSPASQQPPLLPPLSPTNPARPLPLPSTPSYVNGRPSVRESINHARAIRREHLATLQGAGGGGGGGGGGGDGGGGSDNRNGSGSGAYVGVGQRDVRGRRRPIPGGFGPGGGGGGGHSSSTSATPGVVATGSGGENAAELRRDCITM